MCQLCGKVRGNLANRNIPCTSLSPTTLIVQTSSNFPVQLTHSFLTNILQYSRESESVILKTEAIYSPELLEHSSATRCRNPNDDQELLNSRPSRMFIPVCELVYCSLLSYILLMCSRHSHKIVANVM